jgi:hypothetical protein
LTVTAQYYGISTVYFRSNPTITKYTSRLTYRVTNQYLYVILVYEYRLSSAAKEYVWLPTSRAQNDRIGVSDSLVDVAEGILESSRSGLVEIYLTAAQRIASVIKVLCVNLAESSHYCLPNNLLSSS